MMDPVVHFEMPYDDGRRMAKFYEKAFGWQTRMLGEPMEIPNVGKYTSFIDTEGNRVSMLQPIPFNWHAPKKRKVAKLKSKPKARSKARSKRKIA